MVLHCAGEASLADSFYGRKRPPEDSFYGRKRLLRPAIMSQEASGGVVSRSQEALATVKHGEGEPSLWLIISGDGTRLM